MVELQYEKESELSMLKITTQQGGGRGLRLTNTNMHMLIKCSGHCDSQLPIVSQLKLVELHRVG